MGEHMPGARVVAAARSRPPAVGGRPGGRAARDRGVPRDGGGRAPSRTGSSPPCCTRASPEERAAAAARACRPVPGDRDPGGRRRPARDVRRARPGDPLRAGDRRPRRRAGRRGIGRAAHRRVRGRRRRPHRRAGPARRRRRRPSRRPARCSCRRPSATSSRGSGMEFTERGTVRLPVRDVPQEWRLYGAVTGAITGAVTGRLARSNRPPIHSALQPTARRPQMQVTETIRNGVDTEQLFGTLDAVEVAARARCVHVARQQRVDRRRAQPLHDQGLLRRLPGGHLARRGVHRRRRRARDPLRHRHRPEPGRVPAARARRVPHDVARLRRRGAQGAAHRRRVHARGRHGRPGRARPERRRPQPLHGHPRHLHRRGRCLRREAARGRPPRAARSAVFDTVDRRASTVVDPLIGDPAGRTAPGRGRHRKETSMPIQLSPGRGPAPISSPSPSSSQPSSPSPRRSTTATPATPSRGSPRCSAPATSPPRSRASSAASASTRCTTSSSPPRASPAATPRSPSA